MFSAGKVVEPKQVICCAPLLCWFKGNSDGAARGTPGLAASGGLFRDYMGNFLCGFSIFLEVDFCFNAELHAVMLMIEFAESKNWFLLWLESDSLLTVAAFQNTS